MKLKKYSYLLAFILMLVLGINGVEAKVNKECFYIAPDLEAKVQLHIRNGEGLFGTLERKEHSYVLVNQVGSKIDNDDEPLMNWYTDETIEDTNIKIKRINKDKKTAAKSTTCPKYIIVGFETSWIDTYKVYATNSKNEAEKIVKDWAKVKDGKWRTWYASNTDSNGKTVTKADYFGSFNTITNIYDKDAWCKPDPITGEVDDDCYQIMCDNLFGDKKEDGTPKENSKDKVYDINKDGTASIAYLVDSVLAYVRVIVPILIIVLGVVDLARAVIASKEDEMRKAQWTFVKRLILGVAVFFVPLIVDVVMGLADLVWESSGYASCQLR